MNLSDRFKASIEAFITRITAKYDYFAFYGCTVVSQNGDGTLELKPDSALVPGHSAVPIRYGIPGVKATVASGGRALLGWDGGDPSKPIALLYDQSTLTSLTITASSAVTINAPSISLGGAGGQAIARQGDAIAVVLPFTPQPAPGPPVPLTVGGVIAMGSGVSKTV